MALGVSSHFISWMLKDKLDADQENIPWSEIVAELRLANVLCAEYRQPVQADSSGVFPSLWAVPHEMYKLTDFGAEVTTRLRDASSRDQ